VHIQPIFSTECQSRLRFAPKVITSKFSSRWGAPLWG
jgi:hypothetical protein